MNIGGIQGDVLKVRAALNVEGIQRLTTTKGSRRIINTLSIHSRVSWDTTSPNGTGQGKLQPIMRPEKKKLTYIRPMMYPTSPLTTVTVTPTHMQITKNYNLIENKVIRGSS